MVSAGTVGGLAAGEINAKSCHHTWDEWDKMVFFFVVY